MKRILIIGAGQSAGYLIHWLLTHADQHDWFVTVGDTDHELARRRIGEHARGNAIPLDINDAALRGAQIEQADIVVNMLPPAFQSVIAWDCVQHRRHLLSVSYEDDDIRNLDNDARRAGILLLTELGLDPGIDHMAAMRQIHAIHEAGGVIESFRSYGSGVPAPDEQPNPLRYVITWNPRNVVMAAQHGAQYLEDDQIKIVPWHEVFRHTWAVDVPGVGRMEAYPNRDSLAYLETFHIADTRTMIRATLRYPGWSETWQQIVRLGLPNEHMRIPRLAQRSMAEVVEMFLPRGVSGHNIADRVAHYLHLSPTGRIMENLRWLGLFDESPLNIAGETSAQALIHLLRARLALPADGRDLVILMHELVVRYPADNNRRERQIATFTATGDPGGFTAMSKTVGLPTALAIKLLLADQLPLSGRQLPTHERIYGPILNELAAAGLAFHEQVQPL